MDLAGLDGVLNPDPMASFRDPALPIRPALAALAGVRVRRLFGTDAYFTGPVMFAFLAEEGLVLRLSEPERESLLVSGRARPFLGALPADLSGWVVMPYHHGAVEWLRMAHASARGMARSVARKARRSGRSVRTAGSDGQ